MDKHIIIKLENASVYQKNHLVLSEVNIDFYTGDFAYIIGKTGSGKSSLMKVLYGDLPLLEGEGNVVGTDLRKLKIGQIPKLRVKLGIVFQDFQLLTDRTIEENLIFVLKATGWKDKYAIQERMDEVLESVGMETKKHKMPHELSGGEQQRIAIARALLNHPELILADEPTGNLDPETSLEILTLLKRISIEKHCGILLITHDYNIIQNFPADAYRCHNGKVTKLDSQHLFID